MVTREKIIEDLLKPFDTAFLKMNFFILQNMLLQYQSNLNKRKQAESDKNA
jgi:hypothetical protein